MAKKDNKCWYCGKFTMEPFEEVGHGWQKCSSCGATNHPNPTVPGRSGLGGTYIALDGFSHYSSSPIRRRA